MVKERDEEGSAPRRLRAFLSTEVAGGAVLVAAAALAIAWANSPWSAAYFDLWERGAGPLDLREWINEGLMSLFFLVVALEVKREMTTGELQDPRQAALPVFGALGGMLVPAAIYAVINAGGPGSRGWGIPMATDIAFSLGALALVARSLPASLRLFLLTLAIVDDIGAIVVIAAFYSSGVELLWLGVAGAAVGAAVVLRRARVPVAPLYVGLGVAMWLALHEAGVHPTLAGVAVGLLVPTDKVGAWEGRLHPWTSLAIVPLFALANAGVSLSTSALSDALSSSVAWGVALGLVIGKPLGICAFAWGATRLGVAALPQGATWRQLVGTGAVAGIGFTVSLFVARLAFHRNDLIDEATIGILAATVLTLLMATLILMPRPGTRRPPIRSRPS